MKGSAVDIRPLVEIDPSKLSLQNAVVGEMRPRLEVVSGEDSIVR
jgi:hypothetical protein